MNSPKSNSSPTYKHLKTKHKHSPVEIKEKMRKSYKVKIQNCRNMLLHKFRGSIEENDLRNTLTEIYKSMYNFDNSHTVDEELEILEEIKKEIVQEELEWCIQEYEKSQIDGFDWSALEQDDAVICPVCQKANFSLQANYLSCPNCKLGLITQKSLLQIKQSLINIVDKHSSVCNSEAQFSVLSENNESHIYLICDKCMEMHVVI